VVAGGKARDASPAADAYVGMNKLKEAKVGKPMNQAAAYSGAQSERYEKQSVRSVARAAQ